MSIRLVTNDVLRLDVDVETYNRIFRELYEKLHERYGELLSELIESKLTEKIVENKIYSGRALFQHYFPNTAMTVNLALANGELKKINVDLSKYKIIDNEEKCFFYKRK
jgi:hypothetical protein